MEQSIYVATPMYGGMCTGQHAIGMANMVGMSITNKIRMHYSFMMNESLITRARDSLAYDFLASDFSHLLFIDADIGFDPYVIPSMLAADKDIICGLYPKIEINWISVEKAVKQGVPFSDLHKHTGEFAVKLVDNKGLTGLVSEPFEIQNGATGFMLIKREVFEGLKDKVPTYTSDMYAAVDTERKKKIVHQFFDTSIDPESNNLLSEDYHFSKLARDNGFKVWAAPWVTLSHTGTYTFTGSLVK
jgi:hypothetical protein